jgi:polyisoprenoid-binding protein YceI
MTGGGSMLGTSQSSSDLDDVPLATAAAAAAAAAAAEAAADKRRKSIQFEIRYVRVGSDGKALPGE